MIFKNINIFLLIIFAAIGSLPAQPAYGPSEGQIVFLSDTQSPLWIEKLYLDYNDNELARNLIAEDIIDQSPRAVFHLGDLVALGYSNDDWDFMDQFLTNLRINKIPFFPTLGNHELMNLPKDGEANFMKRFPDYVKTGYTRIIGSTAVILLNSNFDYLSEYLLEKQQEWLKFELSLLEKNKSIEHVIVGCHHSPFTNSSMVSGSEEVQEKFVSQFLAYDKCRLFISGHSHRFEHFLINEKNFIVTGGGGGLQHPEDSNESAYNDIHPSNSDLKPFHYVLINLGEDLEVIVRSVSQHDGSITQDYSFNLTPSSRRLSATSRDNHSEK